MRHSCLRFIQNAEYAKSSTQLPWRCAAAFKRMFREMSFQTSAHQYVHRDTGS
jgi:hypothetical protein